MTSEARILAVCLAAAAAAFAGAKKPGDPAKGKLVFQQCSMCHNTATADKKMGPSLKGLYHREKLASGKKVTDATVREKIDQGGNGMPPYKDMLSDQEKEDLIAFLKTI